MTVRVQKAGNTSQLLQEVRAFLEVPAAAFARLLEGNDDDDDDDDADMRRVLSDALGSPGGCAVTIAVAAPAVDLMREVPDDAEAMRALDFPFVVDEPAPLPASLSSLSSS